uniref:Kinesin-like protein KIN-14P isoform X1 n=1 Tax=Cicer arietinum TaxID=3827 RepID=A0A3Q7XX02_CICAR|nr:kinesin-like protein KIN-14P isoform X1 [Cicer arietinum]
MNTPPNNHPSEARDVGSSNSNFNGINLTQRKILSDSKFQRVLHTPLMTDPAGALINHQKHGSYADLPAAKISELMKSSCLDHLLMQNAPTQSLLSVVNGILEESVERRNGEIPQRVACLLRKVVQEIERRISTQQEHLRTQNNIFKTREEKYQSRIRVLETLASGTKEIVLTGQHQRLKNENIKQEEKKGDDLKPIEKIIKGEKKTDDTLHAKKINEEEKRKLEEEVIRLIKEVEEKNIEISTLKQEKKTNAMQEKGKLDEEVTRLIKEVEERNMEISTLKQEKKTNEMQEKGKLNEEVTRLTKEVEDKNKEISTLKQEKKTNEMQKKGKLDEEVTRLTKEVEDKNKEISTLKQEKKMSEMQKKGKLDEEVTRLTKEVDDKNKEISTLKQEKKANEMQEKRKFDEEVIRLTKEVEDKNMEISTLKQEKKTNAMQEKGKLDEEVIRLIKEVADKNMEISTLKQEQKTNNVIQEKEKRKIDEEITRLIKEVEDKNIEISTLKQEKNTNDAIQEKEKRKIDEEVTRLIKEVEEKNMEILTLKQEKNTNDAIQEKEKRKIDEEVTRLVKEVEKKNMEISTLMQESETMKRSYEVQCSQLESKVKDAKEEMNQKSQEYENLLEKLRNKFKESEASFELKYQKLNMKQNLMHKAMIFQFNSIQKLKLSWESIKQDVVKEKMIYSEECNRLGVNLKQLVSAAENYQIVLTENRKLFNEVQELKGNIRVYCRIRPFLPGQKEKQSIVEHIGESDMVVANPSKQGKEALRTFKFNKIFGPLSTQAEVYADIQAFIRSVLDGYNVCIFAYGQTGSGKTYTMSGPNGASNESVGVNYRALNDLFNISSSRQSTIVYEIGVQVIEIYNEQVRDLLSTDSSVKKYPFFFHYLHRLTFFVYRRMCKHHQ